MGSWKIHRPDKMKTLLIATLLCAFYLGAEAQIDCSDKPDGAYGWGCRAYTVCRDGVGSEVECLYPDVFNPVTKQCDDISNVGPPCGQLRNCSEKEDGRYADLYVDCTAYYTCLNGQYFGHNPCPPGLVFNEEGQVCDWPYNVPPPCGTKEEVKVETRSRIEAERKLLKSPVMRRRLAKFMNGL